MTNWVYSQAKRCSECAERAVIPTADIAGRFVSRSDGRLSSIACPAGNGYHLVHAEIDVAEPGGLR